MAKKKSWFQLVRRFFISEAKTNDKPAEKKLKKRKRWFFGRFKLKSLPVIEAPPPPPKLQKDRALIQAEENHSKHALTAAIATAAAAEAAVAAAQAAAEIVRLTGGGPPHRTEIRANDLAAIRIQTAFRGYLARKALRALKGLVRLQAMVRGRAVRRQVITSLQELQSLVKIQTRVREWKAKMAENSRIDAAEKEHYLLCQTKELKDKEPTFKINTQKRCDESSLQIKEGFNATTLSRLESSMRRKHIRDYFLSHHQERKNVETLTESEPHNVKERLNQYWLENWVDGHERRQGEEKNNGSVVSSYYPLMQKDTIEETSQPKLGELIGLTTACSLPRRSFHHQPKRHSIGESFSRSPTIPNYMSATESAKAKARSISTPKQRSSYQDTYSDHDSPLKNRLSFSSVGSDSNIITPVKNGKPPSSIPQISPRMKRLLGPIKSHKTDSKDLSIDSECSLLNLDQNNFFR